MEKRTEHSDPEPFQDGYSCIPVGEMDETISFVAMLILMPGMVILLVYYVSGTLLDILPTYLIVDALVIVYWIKYYFDQKKKRIREAEEAKIDRTEIILKKIEELEEMDRLERERRMENPSETPVETRKEKRRRRQQCRR